MGRQVGERLAASAEPPATERPQALQQGNGALLSERDVLTRAALRQPSRLQTQGSDLVLRRERYEAAAVDRFAERTCRALDVDARACRQVQQLQRQLGDVVRRAPQRGAPKGEGSWSQLALAGFPDRVCKRSGPGEDTARMVGGKGVRLHPESLVRDAALFVAVEVEGGGARPRVRRAVEVSERDLSAVYPDAITTVEDAVFDPAREAVVGVRERRFVDLVLSTKRDVPVEQEVLGRVLARTLAERPSGVLVLNARARALIARVRFARHLSAETFPSVEEEALWGLLEQRARSARSYAELRRIDWEKELRAQLEWPAQRALDALAPARITVPSGRDVEVDYAPFCGPERAPILAVRVQEMFGCEETPRVGGGEVPVLLHLLAPNQRPAAVTKDLASFWRNAYSEVRKDLRRRYPKHSWPEDPLSAAPERRPQRRSKS